MRKLIVSIIAAAALASACQTTTAPTMLTDPPRDAANPARMEVLHIPSGGVEINGVAYLASGAGAHPTLVIAHGWPGNEKNLDLAQAVRRAGWNAITFNYRGSWGSPGEFHFAQVPEDTATVISYLRQPEIAAKYGIDPKRIALAGHSMGGWATSQVASKDPELAGAILISAAEMARLGSMPRAPRIKAAAGNSETLVTTPEKMADELATPAITSMTLNSAAAGLAKIPVLILSSDDGLAPGTDALAVAIQQAGGKITKAHEATDHSWSDRRLRLASLVIDWLQALPEAN
ncbi:MAG TPA: alpha/beta fold hydrolase [Hyphomonadaceae bacterium]|nr:alpha/beta fold hydrolase [Hyphomonadaceae bacterium]HPN06495.1 alpha/beta fold hydrolase [Hyphomonadaceae bacterium]